MSLALMCVLFWVAYQGIQKTKGENAQVNGLSALERSVNDTKVSLIELQKKINRQSADFESEKTNTQRLYAEIVRERNLLCSLKANKQNDICRSALFKLEESSSAGSSGQN
jgi:hypothetical protein